MRIVDVREIKRVHSAYFQIPQPMYVYHSVEEFNSNVKPDLIIHNFPQYHAFIISSKFDLTYRSGQSCIYLYDKNIWIKTVDEFVPHHADIYGDITYSTDENGDFIKTDGCYIQLLALQSTSSMHILYCSSGIQIVNMAKWQPTAAIRDMFSQEKQNRRGGSKYDEMLGKLLSRNKPSSTHIKLVSTLLNPASECFGDFDKAMQHTFINRVRRGDRIKILQSKAFKEALMQVVRSLYPSLVGAIREKMSPELIAQALQDNLAKAQSKESSKDAEERLMKIIELGYTEQTAISDNRPSIPLLGVNKNAKLSTDGNILSMPNVINPLADLTEDQIREKLGKMEEVLSELKTDLNYPEGFIQENFDIDSPPKMEEEEKKK